MSAEWLHHRIEYIVKMQGHSQMQYSVSISKLNINTATQNLVFKENMPMMQYEVKELNTDLYCTVWAHVLFCFLMFFLGFRERGRDRGRKRTWCGSETLIGCFPHTPRLRMEPRTLGATGRCSNPLSHTRQSLSFFNNHVTTSRHAQIFRRTEKNT